MMPLHIAGANLILTSPSTDVRDLHVRVVDGHCVSRWEPTPAELAVLNAGGSVELWVAGPHPPVMLTVAAHEDGPAEATAR